ncbi:MAG: metalloregulator ArsR/SmtB family transcription factor [bacterium]|nr:metalloregulator ArsR/SmtB family transcription factor [bacterium]
MVEYTAELDRVFNSLADPTRRDILKRVAKKELSVSEVAEPYKLTFAAISKHLKVLEKAKLIEKRRQGTHQYIALSPPGLEEAAKYLERYRELWEEKFDRLDKILKVENEKKQN